MFAVPLGYSSLRDHVRVGYSGYACEGMDIESALFVTERSSIADDGRFPS